MIGLAALTMLYPERKKNVDQISEGDKNRAAAWTGGGARGPGAAPVGRHRARDCNRLNCPCIRPPGAIERTP